MNFLPQLSVWPFALAGLIAAAGPVIIHLLNRRRFRVVQWAAMDFLREAIQRNRRIMQLRDILLLLLRTAAVLLFGLALARPYFTGSSEVAFDRTQPLHAVLLVDNSLSMGYESLGGTLLSQAQDRGREFIEKLPRGSRITVLPLCASSANYSLDPYRSSEAAIEALGRIEVVDRPVSAQQALDAAKAACEHAPELSKRVVLLSDQQLNNWQGSQPEKWQDFPVQVVALGERQTTNTWISDFRLQDGIADVESPATFVVQVRHAGEEPRDDVEVSLVVDGVEVGNKSLRLRPNDTQELTFQYQFDAAQPEPGKPEFVPVSVKLPPDRLPADDQRHLVVPVVAGISVVFVDQFGQRGEDPLKNRFGETRHLRRLLVPSRRAGEAWSQRLSQ